MGATQSTEPAVATQAASAAADQSRLCGFSGEEARHLLDLRRMVCREMQEQERNGTCLVSSVWRCSHLLTLGSALPSSPSGGDAPKMEAHLAEQSPPKMALIEGRCRQLDLLLKDFAALPKMNAALEKVFAEEDRFLEVASNLLGMHGHRQKDSLEFVCNACKCDGGDSFLARDVVEFCFQVASALHYILLEKTDANGDGETVQLNEARDLSAEESMIDSMTNSLLEHVKSSLDNHYFGGYNGGAGAGATEATAPAEGEVTAGEFSEWQRKVAPDLIYCSVARFIRVLFFPPCAEDGQTRQPFPSIRSSKEITSSRAKEGEIMPLSSHVFGNNTTALLSPPMFAFASISVPKFGENWYRIFAGADDGWTFQSLEHSILGYEGPALLVMQAHSKQNKSNETVTLGAYTASKWEKNRRDFFGTADCFLFQLQPTLRVLRPLPKMGTRGGHYMYFHSNTNVVTQNPSRKDDLAVGLGFGGTVRHPRLFIDGHLEECRVSHQDTSFEEGYLGLPPSNDPFSSQSFSSTLHIDSLEIYAVGDDETIQKGFKAQVQHRDIKDATLRNARTVDKAAFLGDMRNGVIETKAFAHRGLVDGRAHGALKGEEDGKANGL